MARRAQARSKTSAKPKSSPNPVIWVTSTHWDREWHEPFQGFRYRLVSMLDEVLDTMERDPRYSHFQMDGQSCPIEDYLAIRPENEDRIRALAQAGRFSIGPWLTLPDLFVPSGESFVRNLQEGIRVAKRFGPPLRAGFVCDLFGHHGQFPQILRGFGIGNAFMWRGTNEAEEGPAFRWQSPDGSEVLTYRFGPKGGYCDFAFSVRDVSDHSSTQLDLRKTLKRAEDYLKLQQKRGEGLPILFFDGGDHLEIDPLMPELLDRLRRSPVARGYDIRMGTLEEFARELEARAGKQIKHLRVGELRDPGRYMGEQDDGQVVIHGVLSSRIPHKQANARCETLLTLWAEPFGLFAAPLGLAYPEGFLREAWRQLILNHAHDSLGSCSIDQVHKDMDFRFDQTELIGKRLRRAALERMAEAVARGREQAGPEPMPDQMVLLFNPTSRAIDEPVDFMVRVPQDSPVYTEFFGYERLPAFLLTAPDGKPVPYQRIAQREHRYEPVVQRRKFLKVQERWHVDVTARVKIPAFGFTTLAVQAAKEPTRRGGKGLATGPMSAENKFLAIDLTAGGLLNLTDKRSGQRYEGLLAMEDREDIGDGWYDSPAAGGATFQSGMSPATVALASDGPDRATFRVELEWTLPARFDFQSMLRSEERVALKVTHEITLREGCDRVEVHTTVDNNVKDHRVRISFPSGAKASHFWTDSQFDAVRRSVALHPDSYKWKEPEAETKPQQSWTAVADGKRGLAVISRGLPEVAVRDLPQRPIALTLFRSFHRTILTPGEPGGQIQGPLNFDYWIVPLAGEPEADRMCWLGQRLAAGVEATQPQMTRLTADPKKPTVPAKFGKGPTLPLAHGFMEVKGPVVVTAVKAAADGAPIVRFFNPSGETVKVSLALDKPIGAAWTCDLEEETQAPLPVRQGKVSLEAGAHKIVTIKLATA